jgi:hypothetical protein
VKHFFRTLGSLLMLCGVARGQDGVDFQITVHAPAERGCPSAERLTDLVAQRAGRPALSGKSNYRLSFDIVVESTTSGNRARVRVSDANGHDIGQRELTAEGACSVLEDMLTLVIASSVGVSSAPPPAAQPPVPREAKTPVTAFRIESEQPPDPATVQNTSARSQVAEPTVAWTIDLVAAGRALTGLLPKLSAAASLALFAEREGLGIGLSASWLPPVTTHSQSAFELHSTGAWAEVSLCGRLARMPQSTVAFCGGLQAGALRAYASASSRSSA